MFAQYINSMNNALLYKDYKRTSNDFIIHNETDFIGMRRAGKLAAQTLDFIADFIKPGITTQEINDLCHDFIIKHKAIPAPLNYRGFPKSVCTSINHVICHGIPSDAQYLKNGDIINIDVTVILEGWHGDTSRTFCVGQPSKSAQQLIDVTFEAMMRAIEIVKPGLLIAEIGTTINQLISKYGYSSVQDFCGHGIGKVFHMPPDILHYDYSRYDATKATLQEGMFFTIEPMINEGRSNAKILKDGWTAVTADGKLSAQFEHSIGVTKNGYEIFTIDQ